MIVIPVSFLIGMLFGYWLKVVKDDRNDKIYQEIVKDIKDARRMGFEYVSGRWQEKGV
jgi:hypothetical protein